MGQKITVKVVFNSSKDVLEAFGNNRYLLKLSYAEDAEAKTVIIAYLSRKMGVVPSRITFQGKDVRNNWMFELR